MATLSSLKRQESRASSSPGVASPHLSREKQSLGKGGREEDSSTARRLCLHRPPPPPPPPSTTTTTKMAISEWGKSSQWKMSSLSFFSLSLSAAVREKQLGEREKIYVRAFQPFFLPLLARSVAPIAETALASLERVTFFGTAKLDFTVNVYQFNGKMCGEYSFFKNCC